MLEGKLFNDLSTRILSLQKINREMERQRQLEWEKQKSQELQQQRQREQERVLQLKSQNQNLGVELSQRVTHYYTHTQMFLPNLIFCANQNEKVRELSQKISETRAAVAAVKTTIDGMRSTRDEQMAQMSSLKMKLREQNQRLVVFSQEKMRMDARNKANSGSGEADFKLSLENKRVLIIRWSLFTITEFSFFFRLC